MSYSHQHSAALLACFSPQQLRGITNFILSTPDPVGFIAEMRETAAGLTPIFSLIDLGRRITPQDILDWQTGLSIVIARSLRQPWTVEEVADILDRGGSIPSDRAYRIANDIVSPDTDIAGLAYRFLRSMSELPFVPDSVTSLARPFIQSSNYIISMISSRDTGLDNNATMWRMGTAMNGLGKEMLFTLAEADLETRLLPPDAGGMLGTLSNVLGWLAGSLPDLAQPAPAVLPGSTRMPALPEGGDLPDPDVDPADYSVLRDLAEDLADLFRRGDMSALAAETGFLPPGLVKAGASLGSSAIRKIVQRRQRHGTSRDADRASAGLRELADTMRANGLDPNDQRDVAALVSCLVMGGSVDPETGELLGPDFDDDGDDA